MPYKYGIVLLVIALRDLYIIQIREGIGDIKNSGMDKAGLERLASIKPEAREAIFEECHFWIEFNHDDKKPRLEIQLPGGRIYRLSTDDKCFTDSHRDVAWQIVDSWREKFAKLQFPH